MGVPTDIAQDPYGNWVTVAEASKSWKDKEDRDVGATMQRQIAANRATIEARQQSQAQETPSAPEAQIESAPQAAEPDARRKFRVDRRAAVGGASGRVNIRLT